MARNPDKIVRLFTCYACGDVAPMLYNSKPACSDCFYELVFGKIKNQNINFFGGVAAIAAGDDDDTNPWQANAIRHMEDQ